MQTFYDFFKYKFVCVYIVRGCGFMYFRNRLSIIKNTHDRKKEFGLKIQSR